MPPHEIDVPALLPESHFLTSFIFRNLRENRVILTSESGVYLQQEQMQIHKWCRCRSIYFYTLRTEGHAPKSSQNNSYGNSTFTNSLPSHGTQAAVPRTSSKASRGWRMRMSWRTGSGSCTQQQQASLSCSPKFQRAVGRSRSFSYSSRQR